MDSRRSLECNSKINRDYSQTQPSIANKTKPRALPQTAVLGACCLWYTDKRRTNLWEISYKNSMLPYARVSITLNSDRRCINCGFLGRRAVHPPQAAMFAVVPSYYEANEFQREGGYVYKQVQDSLTAKVRTEPFCFVDAARIKRCVSPTTGNRP